MTGGGPRLEAVSIRPATRDDLERLATLERAAFGAAAWSPAQLGGSLTADHSLGLLALSATARSSRLRQTALRGYALFLAPADEGELLRVGVDPRYRRRGVGARLVAAGLEMLRRRGVGRCFLEVAADNGAAIGLYQRLGFRRCGRRPRYYPGGGDAWLFERSLGG